MTMIFPGKGQQYQNGSGLVTEADLQGFSQRQHDVRATVDHYGLTSDNSLGLGGGALAAHGIDTYVPMAGEEPFDLDVLAVQSERYRRGGRAALRRLVIPEVEIFKDEAAPLNLTVIRGTTARKVSALLGYRTFDDMVGAKVSAGNLATPPVEVLVQEKLAAGRPKDYAGLVWAQAVASEIGPKHPILSTPRWEQHVGQAMGKLRQMPKAQTQQLPLRISSLVENDFDHPAYHRIPRNR